MTDDLLIKVYQCVVDGDVEGARDNTGKALAVGIPALEVIDEGLVPGIQEVGHKFGCAEYFLPDLMLGAKAMEAGMAVAENAIGQGRQERQPLGTVVLGTVEGDIHEIGKNLVALLMRVNGFAVHDLGVDVPVTKFVEAARKTKADIVGLSCLLTNLMSKQKEVIEALREAGLDVKVMVGGAPINQDWANRVGADAFSPDAAQAVEDAKKLL